MKLGFLRPALAAVLFGAAACAQPAPASPQDQFFANLTALCGKSFAGAVVVGPEGGVLESDLGPSSAARAAALREADIRTGTWVDANGQATPVR